MKPPTAYAEWIILLDRLRDENCDEEVLTAMESGKLEWTSGVADRFVSRLVDTVDFRLKRAAELLTRDLGRSQSESAHLTNAVLSARRRITFVMRLATLPLLPQYVREQIVGIVMGYAESAQKAMEDSAKHDRTGKVLSLIRNNAISNIQPVQSVVKAFQDEVTPSSRPRRSIILP
jgi:hypothetical protein